MPSSTDASAISAVDAVSGSSSSSYDAIAQMQAAYDLMDLEVKAHQLKHHSSDALGSKPRVADGTDPNDPNSTDTSGVNAPNNTSNSDPTTHGSNSDNISPVEKDWGFSGEETHKLYANLCDSFVNQIKQSAQDVKAEKDAEKQEIERAG